MLAILRVGFVGCALKVCQLLVVLLCGVVLCSLPRFQVFVCSWPVFAVCASNLALVVFSTSSCAAATKSNNFGVPFFGCSVPPENHY